MTNRTAGFTLAAAMAVIFNTALAWVKDAVPAVNKFMQSITGHHWITHGLADLVVFIGLGLMLSGMNVAEKVGAARVIQALVASVAIGSVGLVVWFAIT